MEELKECTSIITWA